MYYTKRYIFTSILFNKINYIAAADQLHGFLYFVLYPDECIVIYYYYKQLSADIKMYNYKIKTSFVSTEMQKARENKTGLDLIVVYFNIWRKLDII